MGIKAFDWMVDLEAGLASPSPTCRGTRSVSLGPPPLFRRNALLHFRRESGIMSIRQQKRQAGRVLPTPPGPMQENVPLPHSRYNCARFSLYPLLCFFARGRMWLCACWRCREFVKSLRRFCCLTRESPRGPGRKYHPQRLNR